MHARNQRDVLAGFLFIIAGASFAYLSAGYELGTAVEMGPGYFPFCLGLLLAALGIAVLATALSTPNDGDRVERIDLRIVASIVGSVVLFGVFLEPLGLVVSIFALVVAVSLGNHELDLKRALLTSVVLSVACVATFVYALRVQIPVWPYFLSP